MKVWILQNQMRTEKQMRAAALKHRIFFFSLIFLTSPAKEMRTLQIVTKNENKRCNVLFCPSSMVS